VISRADETLTASLFQPHYTIKNRFTTRHQAAAPHAILWHFPSYLQTTGPHRGILDERTSKSKRRFIGKLWHLICGSCQSGVWQRMSGILGRPSIAQNVSAISRQVCCNPPSRCGRGLPLLVGSLPFVVPLLLLDCFRWIAVQVLI
jgi:hypothetical protein